MLQSVHWVGETEEMLHPTCSRPMASSQPRQSHKSKQELKDGFIMMKGGAIMLRSEHRRIGDWGNASPCLQQTNELISALAKSPQWS